MTAMIGRFAATTSLTEPCRVCVFVKISSVDGEGIYATPSQHDADDLCNRVNGYADMLNERNRYRDELLRTKDKLTKLRRKIARAKKIGGAK